jgi:S1-C subfamily serine protease
MSIEVVCPGCQATFQAKNEWAGKRTKCPKCACPIIIAAPPAAPNPPPSGHAPLIAQVVGPGPSSSKPEPGKPSKPSVPRVAERVVAPPAAQAPAAPSVTAAPQMPATPTPPPGSSAEPAFAIDTSAARSKAAKPKSPPASAPRPVPATDRSAESTGEGPPRRGPSPKILVGAAVGVVAVGIGGFFLFRGGSEPAAAGGAAQPGPTAAVPSAPVEEDLADVVARLKTGVVLLTTMDSKGDELGLGSGFLIEGDRRVITNYHVIEGAARSTVRFSSGIITEVTSVIAIDKNRDLAIVELNFVPPECVPLRLAPEATLRQGTKVIAIGHPRGLDYSVTEGIISAIRTTLEMPEEVREFLEAPDDQQWIQTTAAISGGNSGGPLMLPDGRVIGINTWVGGGENLGFAGHARHIVAMMEQGSSGIAAGTTLADYNKKHGGLERAVVDGIDAFAVSYEKVWKEAEAADWRPTTDESKEAIQRAAGGTAYSRPRGLLIKELGEWSAGLAARKWDYENHVRALNEFTIDILSNDPGPVMFFGRVVKTFQETHISRVQLIGRGYFVDVYEFVDPKKHRKVGEELLVMGMRPPNLENDVQRIAAGMVLNVSCPKGPRDTTLAELRDYVHFDIASPAAQAHVTDPLRKFPQIRLKAGSEPQVAYTVKLNSAGQGFDAVRLLPSSDDADDDLVWAIAAPPETLGRWGITSVDGLIPVGVERFLTVEDYQPSNLTLPPRNVTLLVHVSGQELKASDRHLLWFEFKGTEPVELTITGLYRGRFMARPQRSELFGALGLPEVTGLETRRKQYVFATEPFKGTPGDDRPTLTGTPVTPAAK